MNKVTEESAGEIEIEPTTSGTEAVGPSDTGTKEKNENKESESEDSDVDDELNSDISDEELDVDNYYFLQVIKLFPNLKNEFN